MGTLKSYVHCGRLVDLCPGEGEVLSVSEGKWGFQVISSPPEAELEKMGVRSWPTWGCEVSNFPWSYANSETCYLLKGKVTVTPTGGEAVSFGAGEDADALR
eukprot:scaffold1504_cov417-Prasinococcus_capsulatus_cf.AAC.65